MKKLGTSFVGRRSRAISWVSLLLAGLTILALLPATRAATGQPCGPAPCYQATDGSSPMYRWLDSTDASGRSKPTYTWTDISPGGATGGGTEVPGSTTAGCSTAGPCLGDGEYSSSCIALGFSFTYYGVSKDCAWVASDGYVILDTAATATKPSLCTGACMDISMNAMPNPLVDGGMIAGYYTYLAPAYCGLASAGTPGVYTETLGSSPTQSFVVEFNGIFTWASDATGSSCVGTCTMAPHKKCFYSTFELVINEGTDYIDAMLKSVQTPDNTPGFQNVATLGIDDPTATFGLTYASSAAEAYTSRAVRYFPDHPPVLSPVTVTLYEDPAAPASVNITAADPDMDPLGNCQVTAGPSMGNYTESGPKGCTVSYMPGKDFCSDWSGGTPDFLTYKMSDSLGLWSAPVGKVFFDVICVNDAPQFTIPANFTVFDSAPAGLVGFATHIMAGPPTALDELATQRVRFNVTTNHPEAFKVGYFPRLAPTKFGPKPFTGALSFTPVLGACKGPPVNLTITMYDDGGTANGGIDTSAPQNTTLKLKCGTPEAAPAASTSAPATTKLPDSYTNGYHLGPDSDKDGVPNVDDNCPTVWNPPATPGGPQADMDGDGIGDACDNDIDGDGYSNARELAVGSDPYNKASTPFDIDGDGVLDTQDNCLPSHFAPANAPAGWVPGARERALAFNPDQKDSNLDGIGDACQGVPSFGLKADAVYDGSTVHVSWTVGGDAQVRSQAFAFDNTTQLAASPVMVGNGSKSFDFPLPGLATVQWKVTETDPFNPSRLAEANGSLVAPPPVPPVQPKVVSQPSTVTHGGPIAVAYQLPQGASGASLELLMGGRRVALIPLALDAQGDWAGSGTGPVAGPYDAVVSYQLVGQPETFVTGAVTSVEPAKAPAPTLAPVQNHLQAQVVGVGVGMMGFLAAVGVVTVLVALQRGRVAARRAEEEAALDAEVAPADDAPIDIKID
ncbi:MAG: thrombospondin type 3 repeat-containing protein [Thermoplasmatota archaeon]